MRLFVHRKRAICTYNYWNKIRECISYSIAEFFQQRKFPSLTMSTMEKKTVLSVDIVCLKCRKKVMMLISCIEGINSIVLDPSKNTATIIGEADPISIVRKVRKFRKSAHIISVGPAKEEKKEEKKDDKKKDEKKDEKKHVSAHADIIIPSTPRTCHRCDVWYTVNQDHIPPCQIL